MRSIDISDPFRAWNRVFSDFKEFVYTVESIGFLLSNTGITLIVEYGKTSFLKYISFYFILLDVPRSSIDVDDESKV